LIQKQTPFRSLRMTTPVLVYDDRDNSISYTGIWVQGGGPAEYRGTTSFVTNPGATASLTFVGSGVSVYGTVSPHGSLYPPPCSYSIDGDSGTTLTATATNSTQYQLLFFQSPELTTGNHTLVITIIIEGVAQEAFFLDFFEVTPLPIATAFPLPSSTTSPLPSTSKPPVGPIIGGVLGALALLTIAFIAFLFFRWKKKELLYHRKESRRVDTGGAA